MISASDRPPDLRPGDLLTVAETLEILPVGRTMLYALVDQGVIPSIRVASAGSKRGRILIRRADLERFVADRLAERPAPESTKVDPRAIRDRITGRGNRPQGPWQGSPRRSSSQKTIEDTKP